jgi:hypothetical protein
MSDEANVNDEVKKDNIMYELAKRLYDEKFETKRVLDDKGSNLERLP